MGFFPDVERCRRHEKETTSPLVFAAVAPGSIETEYRACLKCMRVIRFALISEETWP